MIYVRLKKMENEQNEELPYRKSKDESYETII